VIGPAFVVEIFEDVWRRAGWLLFASEIVGGGGAVA
jgi:hypothetical protein